MKKNSIPVFQTVRKNYLICKDNLWQLLALAAVYIALEIIIQLSVLMLGGVNFRFGISKFGGIEMKFTDSFLYILPLLIIQGSYLVKSAFGRSYITLNNENQKLILHPVKWNLGETAVLFKAFSFFCLVVIFFIFWSLGLGLFLNEVIVPEIKKAFSPTVEEWRYVNIFLVSVATVVKFALLILLMRLLLFVPALTEALNLSFRQSFSLTKGITLRLALIIFISVIPFYVLDYCLEEVMVWTLELFASGELDMGKREFIDMVIRKLTLLVFSPLLVCLSMAHAYKWIKENKKEELVLIERQLSGS